MWRMIEILKEFQNNSQSLLLTYLSSKFSLTIRTLQKDIQRINSLLLTISDCKIIKNKAYFIFTGTNPDFVINTLLDKLLKSSKNNQTIKIYQLLWFFIWEKNPLSNSKLLKFIDDNLYNLKQQLNLINIFLQYYKLKLSLKFKTKKGWILVGCEQDLRFLATNILINWHEKNNFKNLSYYPKFDLNVNLFYLFDKLKNILITHNYDNSYGHQLFYFLIVSIKRIKNNQPLNNYHCHFFLQQLISNQDIMQKELNKLTNLLKENFGLKINNYEKCYLKSLLLFNYKKISNQFFSCLIDQLKNFISDLILKKYQLSLVEENFKLILDNFLEENCLNLLFNFYKSFNFNITEFSNNHQLIDDTYFYGWEMLEIINFAFKKFNIYINFRLFINNYFLMNFNSLYLKNIQKYWIIRLYYQKDSNFTVNKIIYFFKNKYANILLKSLNIDNDIHKFNFLNKEYTIFLDDHPMFDLSKFKKIFLIKSTTTAKNIDLVIKMIKFHKLCSSILIFDFFLQQKFYNLSTFLNFFQDLLIKKFKINVINFDLRNAFINKKFLQTNILLVHKLVPINNSELPVILVFFKNPLFFIKETQLISFSFQLIVLTLCINMKN